MTTTSTIKPPGFANLLTNPGDVMTLDANGNLEAVPASTIATTAAVWAVGTTYGAGAIVSGSDFNLYVSLAAGNVGHDPTTDGGVHWKPVSSRLQNQIVADSAAINTPETLLTNLAILAGKSLKVGSKISITLEGICTSTNADVPTFTIRAGILGTVADAVVAAIALPASAGAGAAIPFKIVIEATVRTLGAGGTLKGSLVLTNNGVTGLSASAVEVVNFASATLATTTATFLDVSFGAAAVTTTCTFQVATIAVT